MQSDIRFPPADPVAYGGSVACALIAKRLKSVTLSQYQMLSAAHPIIRALAARMQLPAAQDKNEANVKETEDSRQAPSEESMASDQDLTVERAVELLYDAALLASGFVIDSPGGFISRVRLA